jgi:hypothetical protein|mmetsp:Transcript_41718/g.66247  ORF Transcript_41718/g.66247 Transcript_41718/m.66247 type:complete len:866 (-) Transcript_41718:277-2874(-)|eukprot:CAMPEP_0169112316 /NCGR_PEP_ID=MMETSP1015-20121227/27572_1 /TAXON_ID=342587 /ORGANISM="Karlodinium micrum, Strain CCMP2283" /LENGTH=865 /DNA_ID=CAMNT_0009174349 /DNA_START=54 /DNA_END=2651 /DNA_ORIENTATION=+
MASPDKKQKTESEPAATATPAQKAQPLEELEQDAKKDKSEKIKDIVTFLTPDTTMNVMPSTVGSMLTTLQDGGAGELVAGARASVGVKSGRYMFEAKVVETGKKAMMRIGFSAEGSLFLGEDDNSICFDMDGFLVSAKKKTKCATPFKQDIMVAVVLNLDSSSPNENTISLFKDGVRVSAPQALPDALKGKTLFPALSFKYAMVHYNFGSPVVPLPFTCKVIQEASVKDATVTKYEAPADGKHTALFPVSLPDEGSFTWLDIFLEKNPGYTEISDRAFMNWRSKSGGHVNANPSSNDKPDSSDTTAIRNALMELVAIQPRDLVFMEVKSNLIKEERVAALAKLKNSGFKTVADVAIAEPPKSFAKVVNEKTLAAKQKASDITFKAQKAKEKAEWMARKKQKEAAKIKKKAEKEQKKKMAEMQKKREEATKKAKRDMMIKKAKAEGKEPPAEEPEEEKKEEEEPEVEEPEEPDEPEPVEGTPPVVTLTAEEKAVKFFKDKVPDLTQYVLNTSFTKFSLPDADEGFDAVKYSWAKDKEAKAYVKDWIVQRKVTTRVEDVKPGQWFKQKLSTWQQSLAAWKQKQNEYKAAVSKKAAAKIAKQKAKEQKKAAAERKAKIEADRKKIEDAKKKVEDAKKADGEKKEEEAKEEKAPEPMAVEEEEPEEPEEPEVEVDFEGVDVFGVEDVCDIGGSMPLFKDFNFEDFAMMSLRAELHLMALSFSKDVEDEDRSGMHVDHLQFYYEKYFSGKKLSFQAFGVTSAAELIALIGDTIYIEAKNNVVESLIPDLETFAVFIKLTEEARRVRALALEMGDESAKLKISGNKGEKRPSEGNSDKTDDAKGEKRKWDNKWEGGKGGGKGNKWGKWSSW